MLVSSSIDQPDYAIIFFPLYILVYGAYAFFGVIFMRVYGGGVGYIIMLFGKISFGSSASSLGGIEGRWIFV